MLVFCKEFSHLANLLRRSPTAQHFHRNLVQGLCRKFSSQLLAQHRCYPVWDLLGLHRVVLPLICLHVETRRTSRSKPSPFVCFRAALPPALPRSCPLFVSPLTLALFSLRNFRATLAVIFL